MKTNYAGHDGLYKKLRPISEFISITRVLIPFRDSFAAQASPAGPAPMIITS